uniref:GIY-YIG domain-containing protein n=1 Tax=Tremella fuciformis TaxID=64657 RepID=A0A2H4QC17_9TREE|nr:hypothetical protein [Tremella fuciformis]
MILNKYYNATALTPELLSSLKGKGGIYVWINLLNGKRYVGSSANLMRRLLEYLNQERLKAELARGESIIYSAMLKYGYVNFEFMIVEYVESEADEATLQELEQKYMGLLKPEYNILKLAGSNRGHVLSEATRAKMSEAKKGKPSHRKGSSHSLQTREQMKQNAAMNRSVLMYSTDNILLNTFMSVTQAQETTGISRHRIGRAIRANKVVDGKYVFKFTDSPTWCEPVQVTLTYVNTL